MSALLTVKSLGNCCKRIYSCLTEANPFSNCFLNCATVKLAALVEAMIVPSSDKTSSAWLMRR